MGKSLILLTREKRIVDAAILLRSLINMAIDLAYIIKDSNKKEVISIKYCIEGDKAQIKIIEANLIDLQTIDSEIDSKLEELKNGVESAKEYLALAFPAEENMDYPKWIKKRAEEVGGYILKAHNMIYKGYSNIEHHNMLFGQYYVNFSKSEPILNSDEIEKSDIYRPEFQLYLYEWIFLSILKFFNWEYRLNYKTEISRRIKIHKKAYKDLEKVRQIEIRSEKL